MCGEGEEDDKLVRYLLGDLESTEAAAVERRLSRDPNYARRFEELQECLAANSADGGSEAEESPPENLANRTTCAVLSGVFEGTDRSVGRSNCRLIEVGVIVIAAAVVGMLVAPALLSSREDSRRIACSTNLLELYQALQQYSEQRTGRMPSIGPQENAGMFSVSLAEAGVVPRDRLGRLLVCPASQLAEQIAANQASVLVPTRAQMHVAPPLLLDRLRRFMGGSIAYRLGYFDEAKDEYVWARPVDSRHTPVLSDAPSRDPKGAVYSTNHGKCGQNVLYADGHVTFVTHCWSTRKCDHVFLNDRGEVAAGLSPSDTVLAPSGATPGLIHTVRIRYR